MIAIVDARQPVWPKLRYYVGVDLGQQEDPTAIAIIERRTEPVDKSTIRPNPETVTSYIVRHLERLPLRIRYDAVVAHVARLMDTAPLRGNARLIVDQTGVGRPVVEAFRKARLRPVGVTITSGDGWTEDGEDFRVSKLQIVSRLQAMIHNGELEFVRRMPELPVLEQELANFRANVTDAGNTRFGARSGLHDDLVLAVAIACWYAVHRTRNRMVAKEYRL